MSHNSLTRFVAAVQSDWGSIGTPLIAATRRRLAALTLVDPAEHWLESLLTARPGAQELHRNAVHRFMLLAHAESAGLYRPPHDHGRAWVVYAVQSGALEVDTYARVTGPDGRVRLVRRDTSVLLPGEARAYLPGDIHDTRCIEDAILFRFTERDLRHEDRVEHQVTRFVEAGGEWTVPEPEHGR